MRPYRYKSIITYSPRKFNHNFAQTHLFYVFHHIGVFSFLFFDIFSFSGGLEKNCVFCHMFFRHFFEKL